ncbi:putative xylanase/chitin deacetylase [Aspergillus sclerotioniger CBS 115572]|uniref:Putative xylanase/chitin deacetylase n=1 Tax=Aspergillus sclerotioniger CBS 115572 TaxID=1450535 RepID=A0A317WQE9_9EURO|nr:putative xylanase/chitin deacetylase [Aspergillus sclerotioniger CBS 115572]PWY88724.1 putative xylanase/chitin deacetylase [Aspergillus sclerotioniger CBS 115572]
MAPSSFLGLEGLHVFITGAASAIGRQAVQEFLDQGCKVTALDRHLEIPETATGDAYARLHVLKGDTIDEESIRSSVSQASKRFGPINILIANAGTADPSNSLPIWELPLETWEKTSRVNVRGTFLTIKHFLRAAQVAQQSLGRELDNLAIVVTGELSSESDLQTELVQSVKSDIVRLNGRARINVVAPVNASTGTQASTSPGQAATPEAICRTIAFLASHRAAGHMTGQCLNLNDSTSAPPTTSLTTTIPPVLSNPKRNKIRVAVSIDLDAVSGWLGTGHHPDNILADYSAGFFAAKVGVPRLLHMLKKLNLADRCTWFIPGHSAESFPEEVRQVIDSGCEIGLHGYAHEGAYQLTVEQERDVLTKCIEIATKLTGKKPVGYRAPLYQLRESTLDLLEEFGFEYDASLTDHDSHPFFAPRRPPLQPIDFSLPASTWMHPIPQTTTDRRPLVCVPCNWYMEDMTPMQFLPHAHNSHGYTDVRVIENLWKDRFLWIRENEEEPIFPVLMHPDTSGMAHVIGMLERLLTWLKGWGDEVEFCQTGEIVRWFREREMKGEA